MSNAQRPNQKAITARYTGWFIFCPVYFEDIYSEDVAPVPKFNAWWLLDGALMVQQGINWIISLFNPEACGFMFWGVRKLPVPRMVTFEVDT